MPMQAPPQATSSSRAPGTLPALNKATAVALEAARAELQQQQHDQHKAMKPAAIAKASLLKKQQKHVTVVAPLKSATPPLNPMHVMKLEVIDAYKERERKHMEDETRQRRHEHLQSIVERLQEELATESKEKQRLRNMTTSLRHQVETVRAACGTLDAQRRQYETFREADRAARNLRSPEMLAQTGMLTFANMEGGNVTTTTRTSATATPLVHCGGDDEAAPNRNNFAIPGRSAKRTAYCTDYGNQRYLGVREADAKEELQRRIVTLLKARDDAAAATAAVPMTAASAPHSASGDRKKHHHNATEYRGLSVYGYQGADSRLNLDEFKKRSSRRTKMYRDYEGNFIQMDSCDWPQTEGVNF